MTCERAKEPPREIPNEDEQTGARARALLLRTRGARVREYPRLGALLRRFTSGERVSERMGETDTRLSAPYRVAVSY